MGTKNDRGPCGAEWCRTVDGLHVHAGRDGHVSWAEEWHTVFQSLTVPSGPFRRVSYGPSTYGHTSFYLAERNGR